MKLNLQFLVIAISMIALQIQCKSTTKTNTGLKEAADSKNKSSIFGIGDIRYSSIDSDKFRSGALPEIPWTDTWWPLSKIGFANRWINVDPSDSESVTPFELKTALPPIPPRRALNPEDTVKLDQYRADYQKEISNIIDDVAKIPTSDWRDSKNLSGAEKMDIARGDENYSFTRSQLNQFAWNQYNFKDLRCKNWKKEGDTACWFWMGHCHGWAPASYLFKKPEFGVIAKSKTTGKATMFTPGDIRGLLSMAAANNGFAGKEKFLGTRCNINDKNIPRDELDRIVDGTLSSVAGANSDSRIDIKIIHNNWKHYSDWKKTEQEIVFQLGPDYKKSQIYWIRKASYSTIQNANRGTTVEIWTTKIEKGRIYKDLLINAPLENLIGATWNNKIYIQGSDGKTKADDEWNIFTAALAADGQSRDRADYRTFRYFKDCRDLNAGSLHKILAQFLSEGGTKGDPSKATSFVLDVTRDDQVWNHAIYDFKMVAGKPTSVAFEKGGESPDPLYNWRAPRTKKIVDIHLTYRYATENGPKVNYQLKDEKLKEKRYRYTLELGPIKDKEGDDWIIGGEWHAVDTNSHGKPLSGSELFESLEIKAVDSNNNGVIDKKDAILRPDSPDFMWGFDKGTLLRDKLTAKAVRKGNQHYLDTEVISKLHSCSTDSALEQRPFTHKSVKWSKTAKKFVKYYYKLQLVDCEI